jgi:ribonuclease HII
MEKTFQKDDYERDCWQNKLILAGVDEVGRGCSAGPLVTGAVILPSNCDYPLLRDSKELSQKQLKTAYKWIIQHCWYATGMCNHRIIDDYNIYQATKRAMFRALSQLHGKTGLHFDMVVVDAVPLKKPAFCTELHHFTQGESKSSSIAAASILAKVIRDRIIASLSPSFPLYGLEQHKGYHTQLHKKALAQAGPAIIHRKSFLGTSSTPTSYQATLF